MHRHKQSGSYVYHATLRAELTRTLGVQWTPVDKGIAEIAGIPKPLRRLFSVRRGQIDAHLAKSGLSGPRAAEAACLATRPAKSRGVPERVLREGWAATARAVGYAPDRIQDGVLGRGRPPALPTLDVLTEQLLGPEGLTGRPPGSTGATCSRPSARPSRPAPRSLTAGCSRLPTRSSPTATPSG